MRNFNFCPICCWPWNWIWLMLVWLIIPPNCESIHTSMLFSLLSFSFRCWYHCYKWDQYNSRSIPRLCQRYHKKKARAYILPKSLLLIDHATSHKLEVVNKLQNYEALILPAGCLSLVQPLDLVINKPFMCSMRRHWKSWLDLPEDQHIFTKSGKSQRVNFIQQLFCRPSVSITLKYCQRTCIDSD